MSDEIKALVEMEKKLITAIISMYHTTRLSDTPFADHIHSKAIVRAAFASYREAALTAQADEIERLKRAWEAKHKSEAAANKEAKLWFDKFHGQEAQARVGALKEAFVIANDHAINAWSIAEREGQNEICASGRNHAAREIATAISNLIGEFSNAALKAAQEVKA